MASSHTPTTPYRQIRALYDDETITVYQAYSAVIASAAVAAQKLNASPKFSTSRMTWIKPSWSWMLYRAGYSYKDSRQARILALKMRHADFIGLLERAVLSHGPIRDAGSERDARGKLTSVRVQWDPERTPRLGRLEHRSIQIGIPGALCQQWVGEWIVSIEDVTDRARELKRVLDDEMEVTDEELVARGLVPKEREFEVPEKVRAILRMDSEDETNEEMNEEKNEDTNEEGSSA